MSPWRTGNRLFVIQIRVVSFAPNSCSKDAFLHAIHQPPVLRLGASKSMFRRTCRALAANAEGMLLYCTSHWQADMGLHMSRMNRDLPEGGKFDSPLETS